MLESALMHLLVPSSVSTKASTCELLIGVGGHDFEGVVEVLGPLCYIGNYFLWAQQYFQGTSIIMSKGFFNYHHEVDIW